MKPIVEIIKEAIAKSDVCFVNKLDQEEINELAHDIKDVLVQHAEPVEGLFNPDGDDGLHAIPVYEGDE